MNATACGIDLSRPDNSDYDKGRALPILALWHLCGLPLLRAHWLPVSALKVALLRLFGAKVGQGAYVKPGVRVKFPWYLEIGDHCWIGEDVWIDNLSMVTIGSHVCISQGAYLCTGNHDWKSRNMKLFRQTIELHDGCWVGARATLCPGTRLGVGAIVTIASVAGGHVPDYQIWAGNPARFVRERRLSPLENPTARP